MGVETGNYHAANPGTNGSIEHNTIQARRRGIFYNLMGVGASAMPVEYNTITATADDPSFVATDSLWTGVYVISQIGTNTSNFLDNSISGAGSSYAATAGYTLLNASATDLVTIGGDSNPLNTISNVSYGIWETSGDPNGFGAATTQDMAMAVSGVNISASQYGVYVQIDPTNTAYHVSATINGGTTISGATDGVLVSGSLASATISGVTIDDPTTTGILISGGEATISGGNIYDNGTGIDFTAGGNGSFGGVDFHRRRESEQRDRRKC